MSYLDKYTILESFHKNSLQNLQMAYLKSDPTQIVVINLLNPSAFFDTEDFEHCFNRFTSIIEYSCTKESCLLVTRYHEGYPLEKYIAGFQPSLDFKLKLSHHFFDILRHYVTAPLIILEKLIDPKHLIIKDDLLCHNELLVFEDPMVSPHDFQSISKKLGALLSILIPDESNRHAQSFYTIIDDLLLGSHYVDLLAVINDYDRVTSKYKPSLPVTPLSTGRQETVWDAFSELAAAAPLGAFALGAVSNPLDENVDRLPTHESDSSDANPENLENVNNKEVLPASEGLEPFESPEISEDLEPFESPVTSEDLEPFESPETSEDLEPSESPETSESPEASENHEALEPAVDIPLEGDLLQEVVSADEMPQVISTPANDPSLEAFPGFEKKEEDALEADPFEAIHLQIDDRLKLEEERKRKMWLILIPLLIVLLTAVGFGLFRSFSFKTYPIPVASFTQSKADGKWIFTNASTNDPNTSLKSYYWTISQGGTSVYTLTDKDFAYTFATNGTYTVSLKVMDSKLKWSKPFSVTLVIEDALFADTQVDPPTESAITSQSDTTSQISNRVEEDTTTVRTGTSSYKVSLEGTEASPPRIVLSKVNFEGKGVLSLWLKTPEKGTLTLDFTGLSADKTLFTTEIVVDNYPQNQWYLVTKSIDTQPIQTLWIDVAGTVKTLWIDDFALETLK